MVSVPFTPHLRFGHYVSKRYQVFNTLRHEKVFSLIRAYDLVEKGWVCLTCFPRELFRDFPQARAQLHAQATQLKQLRSPLLLNLLFSGEDCGLFFFVEEHPRGRPLSEILRDRRKRNQPFLDREALGLCWLLVRAVEGIQQVTVHGFLHPLDIYLEPWPDGPIPFYPKVAHIGIRTMLRAVRLPLEGLEEEVACYAAPEFISYRPLRKEVDVYGVGAILYTLLTMRLPTGCFVRPSSLRSALPRTVDRILLRSLDEDPDERYATPEALSRALEGLRIPGSGRQEMESAANHLPAEATRGSGVGREPSARGIRARPFRKAESAPAEARTGADAVSLFFSDTVRAVCMVLLVLLNLGLFCQAAMETGSVGGGDLPGSYEYRKLESLFSDSDGIQE